MRKIAALGALLLWSTIAFAQDRIITVASTTSTEQSGLLGHLLPLFEKSEAQGVKRVDVRVNRRRAQVRSGAHIRQQGCGRGAAQDRDRDRGKSFIRPDAVAPAADRAPVRRDGKA